MVMASINQNFGCLRKYSEPITFMIQTIRKQIGESGRVWNMSGQSSLAVKTHVFVCGWIRRGRVILQSAVIALIIMHLKVVT